MERRDAQNRTGASKALAVHYQLLSSYSEAERLAGAPGALIFFCLLFFHQGKKRRSEDRQVTRPIRGTYKGAYAIRPYPAGRKKNLFPSGLPLPIYFKKTYASHQPLPIKKINRRSSGLPLPIHFKKTYISHHPIPIKKSIGAPRAFPSLFILRKHTPPTNPSPSKKSICAPQAFPSPSIFRI